MYDNEIAKMERDLADLKKLQAKITPQVEAKIKELTKDGFLPHEIARVMKLDRKIVSTVAKTNFLFNSFFLFWPCTPKPTIKTFIYL